VALDGGATVFIAMVTSWLMLAACGSPLSVPDFWFDFSSAV
jgi:hypothetical protein